jgi:putative heme transporter
MLRARPGSAVRGYCSAVTEVAGEVDARQGFPWRKAVRAFISVGLVVAIFVFAIPKFASYSQVWPSLAVVFAAFTFGMLAGSVPVTPGGLGTADAVYIAVMVAGGAPSSAAVAGDLVFRTLTYLLPIPVGALTYVIWRRKKSWLKPRGAQPQASA